MNNQTPYPDYRNIIAERGACYDALEWLDDNAKTMPTLEDAIKACHRSDWLSWLAYNMTDIATMKAHDDILHTSWVTRKDASEEERNGRITRADFDAIRDQAYETAREAARALLLNFFSRHSAIAEKPNVLIAWYYAKVGALPESNLINTDGDLMQLIKDAMREWLIDSEATDAQITEIEDNLAVKRYAQLDQSIIGGGISAIAINEYAPDDPDIQDLLTEE